MLRQPSVKKVKCQRCGDVYHQSAAQYGQIEDKARTIVIGQGAINEVLGDDRRDDAQGSARYDQNRQRKTC